MAQKLREFQLILLFFLACVSCGQTCAQSLTAERKWPIDKNEVIKDFYEHPTLGFIGLTFVYKFPPHIEMGCGPSAINLWTWDKNLNLISKKPFPFQFSDDDIVVCYHRTANGWYLGWDKLISGHFYNRRKTEQYLLKLGLDGKVSQSQAFPLTVMQDAKGFEILDELLHSGPIKSRFSEEVISRNDQYILFTNTYKPGAIKYTVLDSSLELVSQGSIPLENVDLPRGEFRDYSVGIDEQGNIHCFDTKVTKTEGHPINLRIIPLKGSLQSFTVDNPSGDVTPICMFNYKGERRYVIKFEDKNPKVGESDPSKFYLYSIKDGSLTLISGPENSETYLKGGLKRLHEMSEDQSGKVVFGLHFINGNDSYDMWNLVINQGVEMQLKVVNRRMKSAFFELSTTNTIKRKGNYWLLYESIRNKEAKNVAGLPPTFLYLEPISIEGEAIEISETSDLGLNLEFAVELSDGRFVIPGERKGVLALYTMKLEF